MDGLQWEEGIIIASSRSGESDYGRKRGNEYARMGAELLKAVRDRKCDYSMSRSHDN